MNSSTASLRHAATLLATLALGYGTCLLVTAYRNPAPVHAESRTAATSDSALDFQLSGIGPTTALSIYSPADHKLYVYPAVTQGSSTVNCSFTLQVRRLGGALERQNCAPGPLFQ